MDVIWVCRICGKLLAKLKAKEHYPQLARLTAQAGDGIINTDGDGNLTVLLLCDECQETAEPEEDSDIGFIRGPQIH